MASTPPTDPVVATAGIYVLTVTGANGCTSTANALVDEDLTLPSFGHRWHPHLRCHLGDAHGRWQRFLQLDRAGWLHQLRPEPVVATAGTYAHRDRRQRMHQHRQRPGR